MGAQWGGVPSVELISSTCWLVVVLLYPGTALMGGPVSGCCLRSSACRLGMSITNIRIHAQIYAKLLWKKVLFVLGMLIGDEQCLGGS